MPEAGGPTTQSGITYQNSIAALFLGRLCDERQRPDCEQVLKVRIEAPEEVDDTVVRFADGHRLFIQAKENVIQGTKPWRKLWADFESQYKRPYFQQGRDRLMLHIGIIRQEHLDLKEVCLRARGHTDYAFWWSSLNQQQQTLLSEVRLLLKQESQEDATFYNLFKHIEIALSPLEEIEAEKSTLWMPECNKPSRELFHLLRDRVGGNARNRKEFTARSLRDSLCEEDQVEFNASPDLEQWAVSIRACGAVLRQYPRTFSSTNIYIDRPEVNHIAAWAVSSGNPDTTAVLVDQAGMGKTVVMSAVVQKLEQSHATVLALKADMQLTDVSNDTQLQEMLGLPETVMSMTVRLAAVRPCVVIIDQIDALSLSMARDQRTLDYVAGLIARLQEIPGVRVLLACRKFDLRNDTKLQHLSISREFTLSLLEEGEVARVLNVCGVNAELLSPTAYQLLRVPLHLDIYMRALQGGQAFPAHHDITSLQDLYRLLWERVVMYPAPHSPSETARARVIQKLTNWMQAHQKTTAPKSVLETLTDAELPAAARYLASLGIVLEGPQGWSFLHQTFFDYCYAKQFVEAGHRLDGDLLDGEQGLAARPQMVQILTYLRGSGDPSYAHQVNALFAANTLRPHLRHLLFGWFGSLPKPTEPEWTIARTLLVNPATRSLFLRYIGRNPDWFDLLTPEHMPRLLTKESDIVDDEVIPYLTTMVPVREKQVMEAVRPFLGRDETWNARLTTVLRNVHNWNVPEALDLYEQLFNVQPGSDRSLLQAIDQVAQASPETACRVLSQLMKQGYEHFKAVREQRVETAGWNAEDDSGEPDRIVRMVHQLNHEKNASVALAENANVSKALNHIARTRPLLFTDRLLPWLVDMVVLTGNDIMDEDWPYFSSEIFSTSYYSPNEFNLAFLDAMLASLQYLAKTAPADFRRMIARLTELPYVICQELVLRAFVAAPDLYADDIMTFLRDNPRRFNLGNEQYWSRQLIAAVHPHLTQEQRLELEQLIRDYPYIHRVLGITGLSERGREQLNLLRALPKEGLSEPSLPLLRALERKFPDYQASEFPPKRMVTMAELVGSPIPVEAAPRLSNQDWMRAMQAYRGEVTHKRDILRGGARELSGVLIDQIKREPERFYNFAMQMDPANTDGNYVTAFISGLGAKEVPADWLYDVIRRFLPDHPAVRSAISWALKERMDSGIPDDLLDILESYVRAEMEEAETAWVRQQTKSRDTWGPYNSYINSVRGSAMNTLMWALHQHTSPAANRRIWKLLEFAADDPSTALRAGAVEHLRFYMDTDKIGSIVLFEKLMHGHNGLLRSNYTHDFLRLGIYRFPDRVRPFIEILLRESDEHLQQKGAELACMFAMLQADAALAESLVSGPVAWRRGLANVCARSIRTHFQATCAEHLMRLMDDEDEQVRNAIASVFQQFGDDEFFALRAFIEAFLASRCLHGRLNHYADYLHDRVLLDPSWSLKAVGIVLGNQYAAHERLPGLEADALIRLVLRVYTHSFGNVSMAADAMTLFDRLMERYPSSAWEALQEWDRR